MAICLIMYVCVWVCVNYNAVAIWEKTPILLFLKFCDGLHEEYTNKKPFKKGGAWTKCKTWSLYYNIFVVHAYYNRCLHS